MSQSAIIDALLIAADYRDDPDTFARAIAEVGELGGWEFGHWKPTRTAFGLTNLTSLSAIYKQHYPALSPALTDSVFKDLVDEVKNTGGQPDHLLLNPHRFNELMEWRIAWKRPFRRRWMKAVLG